MRTQISQMALEKLAQEMQATNFTPLVINRLSHENPHYQRMAMNLANKAKADLGGNGWKLALDCFAIAYRIGELGERYPAPERLTVKPTELEHATKDQLDGAEAEMKEFMKRLMRPPKKPKK